MAALRQNPRWSADTLPGGDEYMSRDRMPLRAWLGLVASLAMAGCGGGSGGGGGSTSPPPPPPTVPPVVSTPTAVRVSQATPFSNGCLSVPGGAIIYRNAEVEPHLVIDRASPNHLVAAWQQDRLSDGGALGLVTAVSVDGGMSWSGHRAAPFSQCAGGTFARVSDPWVSAAGSTVIQAGIAFTGAALTTGARSAVLVSRSIDGGFNWSPSAAVADDDGSQYFNDKESVTIDPTDPRYVYVVWDRLDRDDRGPTMLARSADGGANWSSPGVIYDPGGAGHQTIGNVVLVAPSGVVINFFTELEPAPGDPTRLVGHLALVRSFDKGLTWSAPIRIADLRSVGTHLPSQPQAAVRAGEVLGTFAVNPVTGTLYAAWQDSRFSGGARDSIALSQSQDGGATWSAPVRVNADPLVPAFTPTLDVLPGGAIGITYYDFRQPGSASFQPTEFWLATSRDGISWRETRLAGNFDLLNAPNASGLFLGDYQGIAGSGTTFVALYARVNNGDSTNRTDIFADRLDASVGAAAAAVVPAREAPKETVPVWTPAAQERVGDNLAAVRELRRRQWRQWLETPVLSLPR